MGGSEPTPDGSGIEAYGIQFGIEVGTGLDGQRVIHVAAGQREVKDIGGRVEDAGRSGKKCDVGQDIVGNLLEIRNHCGGLI